jgi:signal transduction histidine kinase
VFWSLRVRILLLVLVAGAVVGGSAFLVLTAVIHARLDASVDTGLRARSVDIAAAITRGDLQVPESDPFAQLVSPEGKVLVRSIRAPAEPALDEARLRRVDAPTVVEAYVPALGGNARILVTPTGRGVVLVGTGLADFEEARNRLLAVLVSALVVLVALIAAGSWVLLGTALRPVGRMSRAAAAMSGAEAHHRLPQPRGRDEIALLGATLNRLLDRIEAAMTRERMFLDDASHEFRTPLTVLRGELELAADEPDPDRVRRGVLVALGEAERLSALAEDLLVLARERGDDLPLRADPVELTPWVTAVAERLTGTDVTRGPRVTVAGPDGLVVPIETDSLRRVLLNLVTNAAAAGASIVRITLREDGPPADAVTLDVEDDGPGFAPEILPRAFERFARADMARARDAGGRGRGTGLGLAIVEALVKRHGGTVAASNDSTLGGARVRIRLPMRQVPAADTPEAHRMSP